jgi:DNA-binding LytR/AlgR family response regulator
VTRVVILEDEPPARQRLEAALRLADASLEVVATFGSVADAAAAWPDCDVVFADIQLADGLSLDLFDRVAIRCPVIFCTAYDEYVTEALARNGIDYLLKPIRDAEVARALGKYRALEKHFGERLARARHELRPRRRLLGRRGDGFVSIAVDEVAYLMVEQKIVTAVTQTGERAVLDQPLAELEGALGEDFFRLNRQILARAAAVRGFRPYFKGRVLVQLAPPPGDDVVVAQENVARFRAWLDR